MTTPPLRLAAVLTLLTSSLASAQCTFDRTTGTLANGVVRVQFPKPDAPAAARLFYRDQLMSSRHWYYCIGGGQQSARRNFRSTGKVVSVEPLEVRPERAKVRVVSLTDDPDQPDQGTFELTYEVTAGEPLVRHEMTFKPKEPLRLRGYEFFVATEQPTAETHRFHSFKEGWQVTATLARTTNQYGRISFATTHPWLALENTQVGRMIAVGVPPANVKMLQYCLEFQRFELSRDGSYVTPVQPLRDFALFAFGEDANQLAAHQRAFEETVDRLSRGGEPRLPTPALRRPQSAERFGHGITEGERTCEVNAGEVKLVVDRQTGAISQARTGRRQLLSRPGGIVFVEWPERRALGPEGSVSEWRADGERLSYRWRSGEVDTRNTVAVASDRLDWDVEVTNTARDTKLLEIRLALPVDLGDRRWLFWDGQALSHVDATTENAVMDTLHPGEILSQGLFPAVCLHDAQAGVALGMQPMHIESFYGAQVTPADGPLDTFAYKVRWALPPGATRQARFVLYAVDPRWSWRSCVARYWSFWPEVFAAPERDDLWGLWAAGSPAFVHRQGNKFIEFCRRMRVGGMELYGPFNRTGDFYPDDEPAYQRGEEALTRDETKALYDTANIAACNLSYVIPTKCERELAKATYADSIIRLPDQSLFLRDYWDVMGGGTEKLAGMFAWGNAFGESLRAEFRQIVEDYQPDGFYMDNGAFVWQDYGRMTEWAAFDDDGRIYTNAGIPYAKQQDHLQAIAPNVHRNPGEFIQYFSGFRAHSHLTNIVGSQKHYVRSHRLIMGYKPIFPGHPDRFGSKQALYDCLEFGGLPWVAGFRRSHEALAQAWAPIAIALARAGWQPITNALTEDPGIRVERFGEGDGTMFTVRNLTEGPILTGLTLVGQFPNLCDYFGRVGLKPSVDADTNTTVVQLDVPAQTMLFLCAEPPARPAAMPPKLAFLVGAEPISIVLRKDGSSAGRHIARCLKGFLELQAELLGKETEVEVVGEGTTTAHANRVLVRRAAKQPRLASTNARTLVIEVAGEAQTRQALSHYLDTVAKPLSEQPPRWEP